VAAVVVVGVVLGIAAAAVNALFSFGMIFATDGCGTGAPGGDARLCNGGFWLLVVVLPWVGLGAGAVGAALVAVAQRRRGRSAWAGPPVGVAVYVALFAAALLIAFG
jgi:hypothetical protein